ncbi:hypothetical protein [Peribacillus butanolivorans]|uniref:hypothetical protein n=1 Tax=Peribacillus butanolivorans TaxID=421767 RepID=UPI0038205F01
MIVAFLTVVGSFGFLGNDKASASAGGCNSFGLPSGVGTMPASICTSEDSSDVNVTLKSGRVGTWESLYYWSMSLQRYENGAWGTIGSRTGFVSTDSPSERTFTNVGKKDKSMRVKVNYYYDSGRTDFVKTVYSNKWTR